MELNVELVMGLNNDEVKRIHVDFSETYHVDWDVDGGVVCLNVDKRLVVEI